MKTMLWLLPLTLGLAGCRHSESRHDPQPAAASTPLTSPQSVQLTSVTAAGPRAVAITPTTAQIGFVGATALTSQPGSFAAFNGTIELPTDDPAQAKIHVVVDMNSTTTKIGLLTKHLKGADFFDVARYPQAEFTSESITLAAEAGVYQVAGRLMLHGVSGPVTFPARITTSPDTLAFDGTMVVSQTQFGMTESAKKTKNEVPVRVSINTKRR